MTMHSAKGLEFPVVFLPGLEDGLFPGHRAMDSESGMEEERRLCYVGMTRAKEKLFLTSAAYRVMYGRGDYTRESTFLREVDNSLLDEAGDTVFVAGRRTENRAGVSTGSFDGFAAAAYSPFGTAAREKAAGYDPLKYAKQAVKQNAGGTLSEAFHPGDRVSHAKFGSGMVIETDDKTVTILFDEAGRKKMAKGIAPLKKI